MSTVGRMAWTFALMKVLTRSRGTPAAAFARYCSRKVLVDTELFDYNPCPPIASLLREGRSGERRDPDVLVDCARDAGVDRASAANRRPQVDYMRLGPVSMAVSGLAR